MITCDGIAIIILHKASVKLMKMYENTMLYVVDDDDAVCVCGVCVCMYVRDGKFDVWGLV